MSVPAGRGGTELWLAATYSQPDTRRIWVVITTLRPLGPRRATVTTAQWAAWSSVSFWTVRKIFTPPGFDPLTVQCSDSPHRIRLSGRPLVININIKSYECSLIISSLAKCQKFTWSVFGPVTRCPHLVFCWCPSVTAWKFWSIK